MRGKSLYETNNYCNITNKERKEENKFIYSRNSIMIGLSFYSNSIRAVRLKKGKKGFVIEQVANAPLYEGDIVQGRIKNSDSVVEALNELKEELKLKDDEEVFVSIPNAVAKIDSIVVETFDFRSFSFSELFESPKLFLNMSYICSFSLLF